MPRPVVYPFLVAVYVVLALAQQNSGELIQGRDLWVPLGAGLYVAALGSAVGLVAIRDRHRAGLFALVVVLAFSCYGVLAGPLASAGHPTPWEWLLLAGTVSGLALLAVALRRTRRSFAGATRFGTVCAGLLTAYTGARVLWSLAAPAAVPATTTSVPSTPASTSRHPDVYLIVPDKYTGAMPLAQHYGFDNRPFEDSLLARGFVVPRSARANYAHTFLALSAMLNYRYLDDYPARFGPDNHSWRIAYPDIEVNALTQFLKGQGYEFVFFPTAWGATRQSRMADRQLPDPSEIRGEFVTAWAHVTMLPTLTRALCAIGGCAIHQLPYVPESAASLDRKFAQLAQLAGDRPRFVFAHLTVPHEPYLYRADCTLRPLYWPATDDGPHAARVGEAYVEQIQCLNAKLLRLVDTLLRRSTVPPVILIQSDHGHGRLGRWLPSVDRASPSQIAERLSVFAAYHIPGLTDPVPDSITPVNAIRLTLRQVFHLDLPPLEDRSYWSAFERPYRFVRVW